MVSLLYNSYQILVKNDTIVSFVWFLKCLFIWDTCETDHIFYICIASLLHRFLCAKNDVLVKMTYHNSYISILIRNHRQYVIGRFHKHRIHLFMDFLKSLSFEKIFNITKRTICGEVLAPSGFCPIVYGIIYHMNGEGHDFTLGLMGRIMSFTIITWGGSWNFLRPVSEIHTPPRPIINGRSLRIEHLSLSTTWLYDLTDVIYCKFKVVHQLG